MGNTILNQIAKLRTLLKQWEYEYYILSNPSVDDLEYDLALKKLFELEAKYPEYITIDSPTTRVGGNPINKFLKQTHSTLMLSLSNAFDKNDLAKFDNDIKKSLNSVDDFSYCIEPKIDGVSISLIYKDGLLVQAITRGDGTTGDDVTNNIKTISSIPLSLKSKIDIEVRGEVFLNKTQLAKLNEQIISEGKQPFSNCRNAASGAIHNLDPKVTRKRNLAMVSYFIVNPLKYNLTSQFDVISFLKDQGFLVPPHLKCIHGINNIFDEIEYFEKNKSVLDYPIDGVVIKLDNINLYKLIGYTSKFPKWAIAYKFTANIVETKLLSIDATVGRTGKINYIARLEPVLLDGSIISNSTLHNADYINAKDIRIGDTVKIFKAGEIIPKVIEPVLSLRPDVSFPFVPINFCPSCNSLLEKTNGEVDQYCINSSCKDRIVLSIVHFASRDAMNINGLSEKIIQKLYNNKFISNISDLYLIKNKKHEIISLDGLSIKDKMINNLIESIEETKNNDLNKLINGLGIRHVGEITARALCYHFKNIDSIMTASLDSLMEIEDIGAKASQSIKDYFENEQNIQLILELKSLGVNTQIKASGLVLTNSIYYKKTICITGSFDEPRNIIKQKLQLMYDAKITNSVTNKTDFLLANSSNSTKYKQAEKLNIPVIKEKIW